MAENSAIEWTDATWTPVVGCDAVSPGCANCYAATMAARLEAMGQAKYAGLATRVGGKGKWTGKVTLWEPEVLAPLKARKPKRWFLTSMGDVFHDGVPFEFLDRLFAVMALTPHHTFYVLTKRPDRAANYLSSDRITAEALDGPLPNVLIGSTVEDQPRADARRQHMERIAAGGWRTFVSYEPALSLVDWAGWEFLSWLISGGESGPKARPSHPDWYRAARDFCAAHSIPYLHKQNGEWAPLINHADTPGVNSREWVNVIRGGAIRPADQCAMERAGDVLMARVGKKAAGRLLDGVLHDGYPAVR